LCYDLTSAKCTINLWFISLGVLFSYKLAFGNGSTLEFMALYEPNMGWVRITLSTIHVNFINDNVSQF